MILMLEWFKSLSEAWQRAIFRVRGPVALADTYEKIKPSIVAFTAKYSVLTDAEFQNERKVSFPPILGTGFIIDGNAVIVTNDHVAEVLTASKKHPLSRNGECIYFATLFKNTDEGLIHMTLDILEVYQPESYPTEMLFGPKKPDIAFVLVKARELPALELDASILREGIEIATTGYPMGTDALTAPGYLHQIGPTLQRGIISAILPFQQPKPHAYALNIMVQGGASGSPVFLPDSGKVIGIVNSSLYDISADGIAKNNNQKPTNISYAIPSYNILELFEEIKATDGLKLPADIKTLEELLSSKELELNLPGKIPGTVTKLDYKKE